MRVKQLKWEWAKTAGAICANLPTDAFCVSIPLKAIQAEYPNMQEIETDVLKHAQLYFEKTTLLSLEDSICKNCTVISSTDQHYHFCSGCNKEVYKEDNYCHTCGGKLRWKNE